jgi:hypothetical protein
MYYNSFNVVTKHPIVKKTRCHFYPSPTFGGNTMCFQSNFGANIGLGCQLLALENILGAVL